MGQKTFSTDQEVLCKDNALSIGGLQKDKTYQIQSVSSVGYIWLHEEEHPSSRIGPYMPFRFEPTLAGALP